MLVSGLDAATRRSRSVGASWERVAMRCPKMSVFVLFRQRPGTSITTRGVPRYDEQSRGGVASATDRSRGVSRKRLLD